MLTPTQQAQIGVIGGSGFYSLFKNPQTIAVQTPYGSPSDAYTLGSIAGKKVAFLPRHGKDHHLPPPQIPYRANMYGFKQLGVKYLLSPGACGSLQPHIKPGDMVINDQFVDRTHGRKDTFYDGPKAVHLACDQPYCPYLRQLALAKAQALHYPVHENGTVVVIQGPRFSSHAESVWFRSLGWEVVNMTQYPEVVLARELEMCLVHISLITDYDTGVMDDQSVKPVSAQQVAKIFAQNNQRVLRLLKQIIAKLDPHYVCSCHRALRGAVL